MPVTPQGATLYLNGGNVAPVKIVAHTGAPAATGLNLRIGSPVACAFSAAVAQSRQLSSAIQVNIPAGVNNASHFSVYNSDDVCLHIEPLTTPRTGLIEGDKLEFVPAQTLISVPAVYVAP